MKQVFPVLPVALFLLAWLPSRATGAGTEEGGYEVIANAFGFGCAIDGSDQASKNIREITIDDLKIDVREVTTGDGKSRHYAPGAVDWGNAAFTTLYTPEGSSEFQTWIQEAAGGQKGRRNITVTLFKSDKSPGRSYLLHECFPIHLSQQVDPVSGESTETIVVKIGYVEFISHTGKADGGKAGTANSGGTRPDEPLAVQGFRIELAGAKGKEQDPAWEAISGGELIIPLTPPVAGSDKFQTTSPGHKTVGEITLRGAMTDKRAALCTWLNETVAGKPWRRNLTVTELLSVDGAVKDGKAYEYQDAFPVRYRFPRLATHAQTGNAGETVAIHLTRIGHEVPPRVSGRIDIPDAPIATKSARWVALDDMAMDVRQVAITGDARRPMATIAVPCGRGGEFKAWYQEMLQGKLLLKDITIELERNGKPTGRTYNLLDCFPIDFQPGDCSQPGDVSVDTITVEIGRIEMG